MCEYVHVSAVALWGQKGASGLLELQALLSCKTEAIKLRWPARALWDISLGPGLLLQTKISSSTGTRPSLPCLPDSRLFPPSCPSIFCQIPHEKNARSSSGLIFNSSAASTFSRSLPWLLMSMDPFLTSQRREGERALKFVFESHHWSAV